MGLSNRSGNSGYPFSAKLALQSCKKHVNKGLQPQKTCRDLSPYW